jgi:hypothetical protein
MSARNVVIIAYGPGETATSAAERHFARRPEDRGSPRILCINTGVARRRTANEPRARRQSDNRAMAGFRALFQGDKKSARGCPCSRGTVCSVYN